MVKKILIIVIAYLIILWNCKMTYSNKKDVYNIEYKGLLWISLDYWSIWKYDSNDKPIKWFDCKRSPI
jgi:hypothetical protein